MSNLDRIFRPELPEGRVSSLKEGQIYGWIPAEITSVYDPEGLGRVKVKCDLFEENSDLPNSNDGYVWK